MISNLLFCMCMGDFAGCAVLTKADFAKRSCHYGNSGSLVGESWLPRRGSRDDVFALVRHRRQLAGQ